MSGIGDLLLTCSSEKSRNFTVGYRLGKGEELSHILATLGSVAEGVETTKAAYALCRKHDIESPIINAVYSVLYQGVSLTDSLSALLEREPHSEFKGIL